MGCPAAPGTRWLRWRWAGGVTGCTSCSGWGLLMGGSENRVRLSSSSISSCMPFLFLINYHYLSVSTKKKKTPYQGGYNFLPCISATRSFSGWGLHWPRYRLKRCLLVVQTIKDLFSSGVASLGPPTPLSPEAHSQKQPGNFESRKLTCRISRGSCS